MATGVFKGLGRLGFCLSLICHSAAFAGQNDDAGAGAAIPPVEKASFHQLVFADDDVAVLNNRYPPGGDSGFHTHYRDIFYVVVQSVPSSGQRPGEPLAASPFVPVGTAGYSAHGGEPRTHRIVNGDAGVSQFIVVEIRRPAPAGDAVSSREDAPQYARIVDNPRLRAWRLILEPGEAAPAVTQSGKGVRIVVRGGVLTTTTAGLPDQTLALQAGDFAVQSAGSARAVRNSGTETIELIELELK